MKICTTCQQKIEMYHGRKCYECRSKYKCERAKKAREKACPICSKMHNNNTKECSRKCKILFRHEKRNDCWIWNKKKNNKGYGTFQERENGKKKDLLCHRESYRIFIGEIPQEMFVLHKCDNPACCNPDHLFLGNQSENMQDMIRKGRQNYPKRSLAGMAKLKEKDVFEIKRLKNEGISQVEISKKYKVSQGHISNILNKKYWR